ncbi:uncharacterized protein TNCT_19121 [Trichonephila clavata]|uniref:Lipocalin/cytosolic fatty-acid binding domain-containing protein n=1 Tax=Trichonephila clavata TaxID=2740835 RepID=A0A8X6HCG8_TRICU|nr:uncharacterized protein TNCT_19121 [Trichonephila clavata]
MREHRNCYFVFWAAVFLAYLICHVHSQTLLLGACPNPPMQSEFSAQDFLGRWYEVERTFVMAEVGWRCITVDYKEESGRVRVETSGNAVKFVDPIKKPNNGCSNKREDLWFSGYKCHQQTKSETCPARKLPRRYKMKKLTSFS